MARKKKTDEVNTAPATEQKQRTNEEQMQIRQSAPKPTLEQAAAGVDLQQAEQNLAAASQQMSGAPGMPQRMPAMQGMQTGPMPTVEVIGKEQIHKAMQTLIKYKSGKANLENRIVDDMKWYRVRHWDALRNETAKSTNGKTFEQVEPASAWLFNCIANKHADAMDNYPSPNILPREQGDKPEAKILSSIMPVILDMNDFQKVYDDVWNYKLITGTGVYGVYWDATKLNGLGDISIVKIDLLNIFWEPGITDIQRSKNIFTVELMDNDSLIAMYPQLQGHLGGESVSVPKYAYDESIDTTDKSCVIDWYYKKRNQAGKQVLHYCKFVNDVVLFATENNPQFAERGFYDHGRYPFHFDPLFKVEGMPTGFGYIDIGKSSQEYIDRLNQSILKNALANTKPRFFIRSDGSVKEDEYANMNNDFIHVDGNLGQDSILPVQGFPLNGNYLNVLDRKIDELKETTGNRDIATGGTASGVTAASAIAAMQEASSKLSRDAIKASYRVFREVCLMCIELIRQFYDMPRYFRILGENGAMEFVQFSNAGLLPQPQGVEFGVDMGERIPMFDIEITAEKQSPYSKLSQNELALQLYSAGFFAPGNVDQALACLDMMDFDRKESVIQRIQQNGSMMQQMMMLAQMVDDYHSQLTGEYTGEVAAGVAAQFGLPAPTASHAPNANINEELGGQNTEGESSITRNARQRVAESTNPR